LLPDPKNIRFRLDLAGGAVMDCGCYPISLIRFLAEAEPTVVSAEAKCSAPQVDYDMRASLAFADGRTASMHCALISPVLFRSMVKVTGSAGEMRVFNPYHPHWINRMRVKSAKGTHSESIKGENVYVYQLRAFVEAVRGGAKLNTDPQDALGNMRLIDAIYEKAGLQRRGV
jgi:predicted dehydrogenase